MGGLAVVFLSSHHKQKNNRTAGLWIDSVINPINHWIADGFHIWDNSSDFLPLFLIRRHTHTHSHSTSSCTYTCTNNQLEKWEVLQIIHTIVWHCIFLTIVVLFSFIFPHIWLERDSFSQKSITLLLLLTNSVRQGICHLGYLATKIKGTLPMNNPGDSHGSSEKNRG